MRDKVPGHPDAGIGHTEGILPLALGKGWHLLDSQAHRPAIGGILDGVGQQVHQDLLQAPAVGHHLLMPDPFGVDLERLALLRGQGPEHLHHILNQIGEGNRLRLQVDFPALNFGHVQNLIDEV